MKTLLLKFLFISFIVITSSVVAQDSVKEISDITFIEIRLSNEGVAAVDTSGEQWYYDFSRDLFIHGQQALSIEENSDLERLEAEEEIKNRAVYELKISKLEKNVQVGFDEYVDCDIVALEKVIIRGWVKGDVKSLTDKILITSTGRVEGDIEAPTIILKNGAVVIGEVIETNNPLDFEGLVDTFSIDGIIIVSSFIIFFILLSYLVAFLMPRQLDNFKICMQNYRIRTYFVGFLFLILLPALILLFAITIVGIVLIPLLPLAYLFAIFVGVIAFGNIIGEKISTRFKTNSKSAFSNSIVGVLILMTLWMIVAVLMGSSDSVSEGFGILFLVISILISTFPILSGIGAAFLTRFGFRAYHSLGSQTKINDDENVPAPPPIPNIPTSSKGKTEPDN
ncbi:MAG: polymer-forming cytoskeletal protein [candidate division Zixibacteria bacterium]|nr:polymer-forming cytoskeletal protein [candidate division Zixibacteria bacterium]